jgi:ADP-heptose:LPS heptosyltransferase
MNLSATINERAYRLIFSRLAERRPPKAGEIHLTGKSKVLIFTCAGIGDTLTDSVVFKALAETFPGIKLAAVIHKRRRVLADHNPYCSQVYTIEKGPFSFWRLHQQLKKAGPWDAVLQLRGNDPEPRCQSYLLDPNVTVSVPNMTRYGWLCGHHVVQPDWDETHGVEQTLRVARYVGADTKEPTLVYHVRPEEKVGCEERLQNLGIGKKPRLVMQIGGGRRAHWRDWPVSHVAEFIRLAAREIEGELIVLGGADNLPRARELARILGSERTKYHDIVGKIGLTHSAALLQSSRCVVSTDTGIMHLSFAVGARVVALIHCNNPSHRVGPYGYGDRHRVVQLPRPANYQSPADATMADISPEQVLERVKEVWG